MIIKALPLSIDFSTLGLNFPFDINYSFKEDLESLSNGLKCSLGFLWNARI
jgi:hypothetical protein